MKEVGAKPGDGATMIERHRPESPHMVAVRQLFFIHEPEWTRERLRKCNALNGETINKPFREEFQHVAAPGKARSIFRLLAGRKEFGLPFSKVVFDASAQMLRSERSMVTHAEAQSRDGASVRTKQ